MLLAKRTSASVSGWAQPLIGADGLILLLLLTGTGTSNKYIKARYEWFMNIGWGIMPDLYMWTWSDPLASWAYVISRSAIQDQSPSSGGIGIIVVPTPYRLQG